MLTISALRQDDCEFEARPGYVVRPCQERKKKKERERKERRKEGREGKKEGRERRKEKGKELLNNLMSIYKTLLKGPS
jgi:hypothetical protein